VLVCVQTDTVRYWHVHAAPTVQQLPSTPYSTAVTRVVHAMYDLCMELIAPCRGHYLKLSYAQLRLGYASSDAARLDSMIR